MPPGPAAAYWGLRRSKTDEKPRYEIARLEWVSMPDDSQITATTDIQPTVPEQLEELRERIALARSEEVGELYRQYVILFLASEEVPITEPGNPQEITELAARIVDSL